MRPLTAQEILSVWEQGRHHPPVDRALLLLAQASPDTSWESLARLPIGQRDALLLTLRTWTFGDGIVSMARCPACQERMELRFAVDDVRVVAPVPSENDFTLTISDFSVRFRLPTSQDLLTLAGIEDEDMARKQLLGQCLVEAHRHDEAVAADQLPPFVAKAVVLHMSEADPQADVHAALQCSSCAHRWEAPFDIVTFFWSEIETWVYRTLREVHLLARAYGWREADILSLSPWRRLFYLGILNR